MKNLNIHIVLPHIQGSAFEAQYRRKGDGIARDDDLLQSMD